MWNEIGSFLRDNHITLAVAESFTGGLLSESIVSVPGASAYYLLGVVAYNNEAKESVLGVSHETLLNYDAVSEETAEEMAISVRRIAGADIGISTTGIAGPTGATDEKTIGLAYIGLATGEKRLLRRYLFNGDRRDIMRAGAEESARLLLEFLNNK